MKVLRTSQILDLSQPLAQLRVRLRTFEKRLSKRSQIETCTADKYRYTTSRFDLADLFAGVPRPVSGRVIHVRVDVPDQMMRHAAPFLFARLGRRDLYFLVDLDRIAIDDLAPNVQRQVDAERRFPRCGRPGNCENWFF